MSDPLATVATDIEVGAKDVLHFLMRVQSVLAKASPQITAAALALLQSAVTAAGATSAAAQGEGLNIQLDQTAAADIKALIANFADDLKKLGIKL